MSVFPRKKVSDQTPFNILKPKKVRGPGRRTNVHVLLVLLFNVLACVASQTLEPADLMLKDKVYLFLFSSACLSLFRSQNHGTRTHATNTLDAY